MSNLFSQINPAQSNTYLTEKSENELFLKFYLQKGNKAMLPLQQITEVLKIQFSQIVPIPQMPSWVMGVYNWRGDILWMVDLGHLIGLNPWYQNSISRSIHTAIVLSPNKGKKDNVQNKIDLGLVVSRVEDIETCNAANIQIPSSKSLTTQLASFLEGYWLQPSGDTIALLNGQSIVAAMPSNLVN